MYRITEKEILNPATVRMKVEAPRIAAKARPGQFIILRVDEKGERIPLTISDSDAERGNVTIIFQTVGATTKRLGALNAGDAILDFTGPLGCASELDGYRHAAVIGGGLGCAIAYPQAKYLFENGCITDIIAGFRSSDLIILEDEMKSASNTLTIVTDDGSNGHKALVTDALEEKIKAGSEYDVVIAIGPPVMMKFVSRLTAKYGIKTVVSMNPIMIDGTGMCGGCRVTVGGETKFACVDGPDFDGHLVDFDELIARNRVFAEHERAACALLDEEKQSKRANAPEVK